MSGRGRVDRHALAVARTTLHHTRELVAGDDRLPQARVTDAALGVPVQVRAAQTDSGGQIRELIEQMHDRRQCMVHGDFSPKNVLVGPAAATWVIDFEVAHHGDPHFDLAFLISHLLLKSVHRPELARDYDRCVTAFATSYEEQSRTGSAPSPSWQHALRHVGCLLLARVRGKSPAEYLTPGQADRVWVLGRSLLTAPPAELSALAQRRDEVL